MNADKLKDKEKLGITSLFVLNGKPVEPKRKPEFCMFEEKSSKLEKIYGIKIKNTNLLIRNYFKTI